MKLFLINGFLGSGKTTAIQQACLELMKNNTRVAVITNDQGADLVDTAFIQSVGIPAGEVPGGCFCCNFTELRKTLRSLQETERPEVIFAESVGSCTDLIATVARPMKRFYPETEITIAVFADVTMLYDSQTSSPKVWKDEVRYIYHRQLLEADILVVNKIDLVDKEELTIVRKMIEAEYPHKKVLYQSSVDAEHVKNWLQHMNEFELQQERKNLDINYDVYAAGEAWLGWLDESVEITTTDGNAHRVAAQLIHQLASNIRARGYLIGHLKFLVDDGRVRRKISYTALHDDSKLYSVQSKIKHVSVLVNARVQASPAQLEEMLDIAVKQIAEEMNAQINTTRLSSFQPAYPMPEYRIV